MTQRKVKKDGETVRKTEKLQQLLKAPVPEISLPSLLPSLLSRIGLSAYLWSMAHSTYKA